MLSEGIDINEYQTRKRKIDKLLSSINPKWEIIPYHSGLDINSLSNHAVEEFPTGNGPADYALFVEGKLLGIIEAKRVSVDPGNVLEQAKRYSRGAPAFDGTWREYNVPFLYSSNGDFIWHLDVRDPMNLPRQLSAFHTPSALKELHEKNIPDAASFAALNLLNTKLRGYQEKAIASIEHGITNKKRLMLLAMATGTGKTYTLVSSIYRLLETKLFRRILFLVDRRALAAQAVREFSGFTTPRGNKFDQEYEVFSQRFKKDDFDEDEKFDPKLLPKEYLTSPDATKTFVYVSTIQRMTVNLFGWESAFEQDESDPDFEEEADQFSTPIPIHAFDLIIADECHRGYTAKEIAVWRRTIDYFDAIKIGLTATPAAHTVAYFGKAISKYSTEEAVLDGYLVDYEPYLIHSNVWMNGAFLNEGEQVGVVDPKTGMERIDILEDERQFESSQIERDITSLETNRLIIEELKKYTDAHEAEYGRFPKTLIFAVNDLPFTSHADQIARLCKEIFNKGDDFVQKITGNKNVDRPLRKIRQFRNRPKPGIVVTVDMLSTGVDIPALEFIVFMRPVKSRTLWVQMLGRGTRLCPEINKGHFKIFDCFGGTLIKYFKDSVDFKIESPRKEPLELEQIIENIYQNVNRSYYTKLLIRRLRRISNTMSGKAVELFAEYIHDGNVSKFADELPDKIKNDFLITMKLLRNKNFIDLLKNYPRAYKEFLKGYEIKDKIISEELILGEKPVDYLDSFAKFIQNNPEHILAIKILLNKPADWNTAALNELRDKLRSNKFSEQYLQKAYKLVHHKSLADIISMVKHSADKHNPILTAEERVKKVISHLIEENSFNYEQLQWIKLIEQHLIQNLSIEEEDIEYGPVFEREGGLGKARRIFGKDELQKLIKEINYNLAA